MILVTVVASKGINKIARITAVGGIAVMCLNLVLLLVSITILLLNGGHFAQDINFLASPNPGYQSGLAMLSFVVFAIFAYGGIEAVGGLVDKTENPEKNFAKGIVFAAIVISIGYSLEHNHFFLMAQPITGMRGDVYHEILLRMKGENDELISPDSFLPVAAMRCSSSSLAKKLREARPLARVCAD